MKKELLLFEDSALGGSSDTVCGASMARVPASECGPVWRTRGPRLVVPGAQLHGGPALSPPAALHAALRAPLLSAPLEHHLHMHRSHLL